MVKDYTRKTYLLIDMSVPTDNNKSVKEYDEEIERPGNKTLLSKTDRKIKTNRPDLVVKDYKRKPSNLANR